MSPTAVTASPVQQVTAASLKSHKGSALVIGSLSTAEDGKYQSIISELQESRTVDKLLLDRLVDGATTLNPDSYASTHVTLAASDYATLGSRLSTLLSQILSGLTPSGTLYLIDVANIAHSLLPELKMAGFHILSSPSDQTTVIAQKPSYSISASFSLKQRGPAASAAVPLLNRKKTDSASKKALWTLSAPTSSMIDAEALLTAEDKARPIPTCEPANPAAPRRKKACKGCTCGLAELEEEELKRSNVVMLDGSVDGKAIEVTQSEKERLMMAAKAAPKATSSCGSCFLGDAFRCADCPYRGLPAFKPGEKVEIDFGMDDI